MTITEANFLDLANLLIWEIVGSVGLFIVLGIIVITFFMVKKNMPIQVILTGNLLFIGLVSSYVYNSLLLMIVLIVFAVVIYAIYPKMFKR